MRKILLAIITLAVVVVMTWFIWPEDWHKVIYRYTISPADTLKKDTVLRRDNLVAGINNHGNLNYLSNGAWIGTITDLYAPYILLKDPMAERKLRTDVISYKTSRVFKAGSEVTAVTFSGFVKSHPYIHVKTTYSVSDSDTVFITSDIISTKKHTFVWIGDRIKTNTRSIWFYIPGIGDIFTGPRDAVSPQKPYIAMIGRANQLIGFYYLGENDPPYIMYDWNWIASVYSHVDISDKPFLLKRVISTRSTTGMDYKKVADSQYKHFTALQHGIDITASSENIFTLQNKPVMYNVYVKNITDNKELISNVIVFTTDNVHTSDPYTGSVYIMPGRTKHFTFKITPKTGGSFYIYPAVIVNGSYAEGAWTKVFSNGAGWYSADMHNHSTYSFNFQNYPVTDMVEAAKAKGLDIVSLTDYNTFSQANACRTLSTKDFICIPGEEIANPYWGHANAQFIHKKVYEFLPPQHWIDDVKKQGGMFFINHPFIDMKKWRDYNITGYNGIEVLNGAKIPMDPDSIKAFDKWDELNRKGLHLYGIADSDAHTPYAIGTYRDYVYAASFTLSAIEHGFRNGAFYGTNGPMIAFMINGQPMGSELTIKKGQPLDMHIAYLQHAGAPDDEIDMQRIILFKNGYILRIFDEPSINYKYHPDDSGFYRIEVFTNNGGFAFSNPIWVTVE